MPQTFVFQPSDALTLAIFVAVLIDVVAAVLIAVWVAAPRRIGQSPADEVTRFAVLLALWLGALMALVVSGLVARQPMPWLMVFLVASTAGGLALGLSPLGGRIAAAVPLMWLVFFHSFRLPLEWVLHRWAAQGTVPPTMTWTGSNFDVVTGVLAFVATPIVALSPRFGRAAAWIFNVVGLALLANVARVAVLSAPVPFGWHLERPLLLALHFPYALIVPVCVAGALAGHIVLTRKLLAGG